jgi:hypothetical protein
MLAYTGAAPITNTPRENALKTTYLRGAELSTVVVHRE